MAKQSKKSSRSKPKTRPQAAKKAVQRALKRKPAQSKAPKARGKVTPMKKAVKHAAPKRKAAPKKKAVVKTAPKPAAQPKSAQAASSIAAPTRHIPIAVQLYSVRDDCKKDLPGVLKGVAAMGYAGIEFAGYYDRSASALRSILDDLGLKCAGTHTGLESLLGDNFQRTVEFNQTLGNKFLIVPGVSKERSATKASWLDTARLLNEVAEKLKPLGLYTGYHNHQMEFTPLEGALPWDILFANTCKEVVMQVDTGNALQGGANVVPFVSKYPGRALTVHLKEYNAENNTALFGEGHVDWGSAFQLCETVGATEWYIVEQEGFAYPPMECVARCLQKLREWGR